MTNNHFNPHSSWKPIGDPHRIAGFAIPAPLQTHLRTTDKTNFEDIRKAARTILNNPLQIQQLADRVYALLLEDLHQQQERQGSYGERH